MVCFFGLNDPNLIAKDHSIKGLVNSLNTTEVLDTMRKLQPSVTPFPLKDQYIPAICGAKGEAGDEADSKVHDDEPEPASRKRKSGESAEHVEETAKPVWSYSAVRDKWINDLRFDKRVSYNEAKALWDRSDAKKALLKNVSVAELKRRKFIRKGCTVNPWA